MISPITPHSPQRFHDSPTYSHTDHIQFRHIPAATRCRLYGCSTRLLTLESFVLDALSKPSNRPTEPGDAGVVIAAKLEVPMTQHWTDCQTAARQLLGKTFAQRLRFASWDTAGNLLPDRVRPRALLSRTIRQTVSLVAATCRKRERPSPFHNAEPPYALLPDVDHLLHSFAERDPPTSKQCAITPKFLRHAAPTIYVPYCRTRPTTHSLTLP
jgi:hypothetical protein